MTDDAKSVARTSQIWVYHPVVGVVGTLASVIGIPLAVALFVRSLPSRELAIVEPPVRSVFLTHDAPAVLEVRIHGAPVTSKDVFAVQLAFWNRGNQSIRPENVLEPLIFKLQPGTEVVDTKILRRTREICAITATRRSDSGDVEIGWRILEPGDGAVVQMVIAGDQAAQVQVSGTLESARSPRIVRLASALQDNGREQLWSTAGNSQGRNAAIAVGVVSGLVAFSICSGLPKNWRRLVAERKFIQLGLVVCVGVVCIAMTGLTIFALCIDYATTYRVPSSLMSQADSQ